MVSYVTILTEPRQHHILPAFYLAGFTDTGGKDGTLHVFDYARKRSYTSKPEKVARERDFYRILQAWHRAVHHREGRVGKIGRRHIPGAKARVRDGHG